MRTQAKKRTVTRAAEISRKTAETDIRIRLPADQGVSSLSPLELLEQYWKAAHVEQAQIVHVLDAVLLQGAEVVRVADLRAPCLEDGPVALLAVAPDLALEVAHEVGNHPIVVEQGVVDVEQEHDARREIPRKAQGDCGGSLAVFAARDDSATCAEV